MATVTVQSASIAQGTAEIMVTFDDGSTAITTVDLTPFVPNSLVNQMRAAVVAAGAKTKAQIKAAIEGAQYDFSQGLF